MSVKVQDGTILLLPLLVVDARDSTNVILETPEDERKRRTRFHVSAHLLQTHGIVPEAAPETETVRVQEAVEISEAPRRGRRGGVVQGT